LLTTEAKRFKKRGANVKPSRSKKYSTAHARDQFVALLMATCNEKGLKKGRNITTRCVHPILQKAVM